MSSPRPLEWARSSTLAFLTVAVATACVPSLGNDQQPAQDDPPATVAPRLADNCEAACEQAEVTERSKQRVEQVQDRHGSALLDHPNVQGAGVSRCGTNWVIVVWADQSMPADERISELDGVSVIWLYGGPFTADSLPNPRDR